MTAEEKQAMMEEIMSVVDKHVAKSEGKSIPQSENKYGREYGISDEKMAKWKAEYRAMRIEGQKILDEVRNHPIDTSRMTDCPSFNIEIQASLLK